MARFGGLWGNPTGGHASLTERMMTTRCCLSFATAAGMMPQMASLRDALLLFTMNVSSTDARIAAASVDERMLLPGEL